MDHDDGLYLTDNLSGSDIEEDEIDSDLEDKLYAAVFYSNDISSKNQEIPGYNNFTSLTNVIGAWKSVPDKNVEFLSAEKVALRDKNTSLCPLKNSKDKDKLYAQESEPLKSSDERIDHRNKNRHDEIAEEISRHGNNVEESCGVCTENIEPCDVAAGREKGIDIYGDKELGFRMETIQGKSVLQDGRENAFSWGDKRSPQTKIAKKYKNSPNKFSKSKDSRVDKSPMKSHRRNDSDEDADTCVENYSRNNSELASAPEDAAESSDIKAEEKIDKDESADEERRIFSAGNQPCGVAEALSIKPEEEFEGVQLFGHAAVDKRPEEGEAGAVKPEEEKQIEKVVSMENDVTRSSSNSSSSDSWLCSSQQGAWGNVNKGAEEREKSLPVCNDWEEIITLDDSEGSICEIPVPPKPRPPTINLEDSESSSSSSDSDTSTEVMTPQKLVESYKIAVSESKSKYQKAAKTAESTTENNPAQSRETYDSLSDSNDSMTESEEENWGIIAGSQINKDKPATSSSRNVRMSEIRDNLTAEVDQQDSNCPGMEDGDKSMDLVSEEQANPNRESQRELLTGDSETTKKTCDDLAPDKSIVVEHQLDKTEILSLTRQTSAENNIKEKDPREDRNVAEDDTVIINAESAESLPDFEESRQPGTSTRIPRNRKRGITDSGKKSKNQISLKKAKSCDGSGTAGSSGNKSQKENKENREKQKSCATDYFFTPMNSEMQNYYNESWGGETLDIDTIRKQMPRDPRHWAILNEDLLGYQQRRPRYWTENKCRNCNHTGHRMAECPERKKVVSCHMCGASGHREPRCPHKMCLGCGKKQKTYMQVCNGCRRARCNGCQSYGHVEDFCPDLWRRYHVTTSQGDLNTQLSVADVMKPPHLLSCCNCARRGHDSTTCDNYRWSRHFPTPAYVTNYNTGPTYAETPVLEDVRIPSDTRDQTDKEKSHTVGSGSRRNSSSNEGKRRKSNADKVTIENREANENSQNRSKDVEKNVEKVGEQLQKNQSKSNEDKIEKTNELIPTNAKTAKGEEILLTLKSQLLDDKLTRAANYGECIIPLLPKQLEVLVESDLSRQFLTNLISQFPIKFEIKPSLHNRAIAMTISSTRDLHFPIQLTVMDWLKWPSDERSRFVNLNLPTTKEDLIKLLSSKLEELSQNLGDPLKLYSQIELLKGKLRGLQRQSRAGKKMSTCSKRAHIVEELAKAQCKMNMILFGQVKLKQSEKSCKYLKNVLCTMQKPGSPSYICVATYLQIVHHYNIIFAAYTPDNLCNLLNLYKHKYCGKFVPRKKKKPLSRDKDATYVNFIKALNNMNEQQNTNSSSDGPNQIISEIIDLDGGRSDAAFSRGENRNAVENQFVIPEKNLNNTNLTLNSSLPPSQYPIIYDLDRLENNYYNSQYDFGNNSNFQRHRDTAQTNRQQEDYIALDSRSLQNDCYNAERGFNNFGGGDYSRKSRGRYTDKSTVRNYANETIQNGFENYHGNNVQSNSSMERNRWQESFSRHNLASQDMFSSDTQVDSSQNFLCNDTSNVFSRNEIERRSRHDENGPSTSKMHNQLRIHSDHNRGPGAEQHKTRSNKNKKKKKKKNKETKLPVYLQKRAAKNVTKYMESGVPRITQAAKELQSKLSNNNLSLQCVQKFEALVKHKLKKTDHLL